MIKNVSLQMKFHFRYPAKVLEKKKKKRKKERKKNQFRAV